MPHAEPSPSLIAVTRFPACFSSPTTCQRARPSEDRLGLLLRSVFSGKVESDLTGEVLTRTVHPRPQTTGVRDMRLNCG